MTIATNNGVPIIRDGKVVTDCGCCGGWYCFYECNAGPLNPPASLWASGPDNAPPCEITLRFLNSGAKMSYWVSVGCDLEGTSCLFLDEYEVSVPSDSFVDTLALAPAFGLQSPLCWYQSATAASRFVLPGIACGSGWDAMLNNPTGFSYTETRKQRIEWDLSALPQCISEQASPCFSLFNQKGNLPFDLKPPESTWSNLPCQTLPNSRLAGFSWTYCLTRTTECRAGNGRSSFSITIPLMTVEVV